MTRRARIPKVVLLLDPSRGYERSLLQGIWRYAHRNGPWLFIREAPYYQRFSGLRSESPRKLASCEADGIIAHFRPNIDQIARLGLPMVVVPGMEILPGMVNLVNDDRAIGRMAAEHLHELGLKHFAYAGFDQLRWSLLRRDGFRERLAALGHQVECHLVNFQGTRASAGRGAAALLRWLRGLPKPAGLMACNDEFALSISELCQAHDIPVPDEVALVGVDNDEIVCELSSPPLSSVAVSAERAGYEAAELLDEMMRGQGADRVVKAQASHLVRRRSTDVTAVEDIEVAKALRFIRDNSHRVLQVDDVARVTSLSRRSLADRFRQQLGRTIGDEINHRRVEQITRLLATTDRSVADIAQEIGYFSDKHIARYFHRHTGLTPSQYRQQHGTQ
ncbi:MAG: DNA-binding transcriptional regulator [Pirellulales bacterium]|nr:DNA-binding transcriptional regulator [Pirellulales bacterium]